MSDWQAGDLALCVDDTPPRNPLNRPAFKLKAGQTYCVSAIVHGILVDGEPPHRISPIVGPVGWREERFRKIRPDEHQSCEPEFVTLLENFKRKVSA
jgi:hypothetical protein